MLRSATLLIALALLSLPAGAFAQDTETVEIAEATEAAVTEVALVQDGAPQLEADLEEEEEEQLSEEDYDDEEYYEEDFCGGDELSLVDEAYYAVEGGDPEYAVEVLSDALRRGQVETWERTRAIVTLADAQLELGDPGRAALNYRRALAEDAAEAGTWAQVRLASALLMRYRAEAAYEVASGVVDAACAERYGQTTCYAAHAVIAETGPAPERAASAQAMEQLRTASEDQSDSFDEIDERLAPRRTAGAQASS